MFIFLNDNTSYVIYHYTREDSRSHSMKISHSLIWTGQISTLITDWMNRHWKLAWPRRKPIVNWMIFWIRWHTQLWVVRKIIFSILFLRKISRTWLLSANLFIFALAIIVASYIPKQENRGSTLKLIYEPLLFRPRIKIFLQRNLIINWYQLPRLYNNVNYYYKFGSPDIVRRSLTWICIFHQYWWCRLVNGWISINFCNKWFHLFLSINEPIL